MPCSIRVLVVCLTAGATLAPAIAAAQPAPRGGLTELAPAPVPSNLPPPAGPHVLFSIGGFGLVVNAPVQGANSNTPFRTFEGQPMTGREALLPQTSGLFD